MFPLVCLFLCAILLQVTAHSELGAAPPSFNQWLDTFADPNGQVKRACERAAAQQKAQQLLATEAAPLVPVKLADAPRAYKGVGEAGRGAQPPIDDDAAAEAAGAADVDMFGFGSGVFGGGGGGLGSGSGRGGGSGACDESDAAAPRASTDGSASASLSAAGSVVGGGGAGPHGEAQRGDTVWYRPLSLTKHLLHQWLNDASRGKRDSDGTRARATACFLLLRTLPFLLQGSISGLPTASPGRNRGAWRGVACVGE
jgi:hypothetical protein